MVFIVLWKSFFWALNWPKIDRKRKNGSGKRREKMETRWKLPQQIVHLWNIWVVNFFPPYYLRSKLIETDNRILVQPFFLSFFFNWIVWFQSTICLVTNLPIEYSPLIGFESVSSLFILLFHTLLFNVFPLLFYYR